MQHSVTMSSTGHLVRNVCSHPFLLPTGSTGQTVSSVDALFEHLCVTVLQQSHLCPVPLETRPVYWQYDHALHLYPAPDLVVLADSAAAAQFSFKDTEFVNPVRAGVTLTCFACAGSKHSTVLVSALVGLLAL